MFNWNQIRGANFPMQPQQMSAQAMVFQPGQMGMTQAQIGIPQPQMGQMAFQPQQQQWQYGNMMMGQQWQQQPQQQLFMAQQVN